MLVANDSECRGSGRGEDALPTRRPVATTAPLTAVEFPPLAVDRRAASFVASMALHLQ